MTVVALLTRPPRPGVALPDLVETAPITAQEAAELYEALIADAMRAVAASGGQLLVNYRTPEDVTGAEETGTTVEAELRAIAADALDTVDEVRFEVQVGSSPSARVGNTITHLLEQEGTATAAVLRPEAPFVTRADIDSAAMQLRTNEAVLGAAADGRLYYAGFSDPVDFEDALRTPALVTMTGRAAGAGFDVEFGSEHPVLERGSDLANVLTQLQARETAGRPVPASTAHVLDGLDLDLEATDGGVTVTRR